MLWGTRALTRCPLSGSFERDGSRCRRNAPLLWREVPLRVPSPNLPIHLTHPLVREGRLSYLTGDSYPRAFQQRRVWGAGLWPWGGLRSVEAWLGSPKFTPRKAGPDKRSGAGPHWAGAVGLWLPSAPSAPIRCPLSYILGSTPDTQAFLMATKRTRAVSHVLQLPSYSLPLQQISVRGLALEPGASVRRLPTQPSLRCPWPAGLA